MDADLNLAYALVASGSGRKLERFGAHLVDRPSPQALWRPLLPAEAWRRAEGVYLRSSSGGGAWRPDTRLPERWVLEHAGLKLVVKPTGFGHLGVFPEHETSWRWIEETVALAVTLGGGMPEVLNLFAYTGASTLAAARAGAQVCHVDAAPGIVTWARENAELSKIPGDRVRWIVDDVLRFIERERKRRRRYQGIILDPPTYGRGKRKEVWMLERDIVTLLDACAELLEPGLAFIILSSHTPQATPRCLENLLRTSLVTQPRHLALEGEFEHGELAISSAMVALPAGAFARWRSPTLAAGLRHTRPVQAS